MEPLMQKHFELLDAIQNNDPRWEQDLEALEAVVSACNEQIAIAPEVAQLFHQEFEALKRYAVAQGVQPLPPSAAALPVHSGYTRLVFMLEKQGRLTEAMCLCREARDQGWAGDWQNRIGRYQRQQS